MNANGLTLRRILPGLGVLVLAASLIGCSGSPDAAAPTIEPDRYASAFDAARDVLRERGFTLERIDARAGVITTAPKPTAGLATPWDVEQQSAGQEVEDLLQNQQRVVRITFLPAAASAGAVQGAAVSASATSDESLAAQNSLPDLLEFPSPTLLEVQVMIERINRPHWRVDSTSIRLHHYAYDPDLAAREMQPRYEVPLAEDREAAQRIMSLILARIDRAAR